jgi:hypothetical protein
LGCHGGAGGRRRPETQFGSLPLLAMCSGRRKHRLRAKLTFHATQIALAWQAAQHAAGSDVFSVEPTREGVRHTFLSILSHEPTAAANDAANARKTMIILFAIVATATVAAVGGGWRPPARRIEVQRCEENSKTCVGASDEPFRAVDEATMPPTRLVTPASRTWPPCLRAALVSLVAARNKRTQIIAEDS